MGGSFWERIFWDRILSEVIPIGTWYFEKDIWPGIVSRKYIVFFESRLIIFIESSIHLK